MQDFEKIRNADRLALDKVGLLYYTIRVDKTTPNQ